MPIAMAAAYSGLSSRKLWHLIGSGTLPVIRIPGQRRVLLDRLDLDALLVAHRITEAPR